MKEVLYGLQYYSFSLCAQLTKLMQNAAVISVLIFAWPDVSSEKVFKAKEFSCDLFDRYVFQVLYMKIQMNVIVFAIVAQKSVT